MTSLAYLSTCKGWKSCSLSRKVRLSLWRFDGASGTGLCANCNCSLDGSHHQGVKGNDMIRPERMKDCLSCPLHAGSNHLKPTLLGYGVSNVSICLCLRVIVDTFDLITNPTCVDVAGYPTYLQHFSRKPKLELNCVERCSVPSMTEWNT